MAKVINFRAGTNRYEPKPAAGGPRLPAWTGLIDHSPWYRLAAWLCEEASAAPFKLDSAGCLPDSVAREAWDLLGTVGRLPADEESGGGAETAFPSLLSVRHILENLDVLVASPKNLRFNPAYCQLLEHRWQLWSALHKAIPRQPDWRARRHPAATEVFRSRLPESLGALRAALDAWGPQDGAILSRECPRLAEIDSALGTGTPSPAVQPAGDSRRFTAAETPPLPWEEDWHDLHLAGLALPLGLITREALPREPGSAWSRWSPLRAARWSATPLFEAL